MGSMCIGLLVPVVLSYVKCVARKKNGMQYSSFPPFLSLCRKLYLKTHWFHAFAFAFFGQHIPLQMYEIADLGTLLSSKVPSLSLSFKPQVCFFSSSSDPRKVLKDLCKRTYLWVLLGQLFIPLLKHCPAYPSSFLKTKTSKCQFLCGETYFFNHHQSNICALYVF